MAQIVDLPVRPCGTQGLRLPAQGLGCMGMSAFRSTCPLQNTFEFRSICRFRTPLCCPGRFAAWKVLVRSVCYGVVISTLLVLALRDLELQTLYSNFGKTYLAGAMYGPSNEEESLATIHRALELGVKHLDTAEMYGVGTNEQLVGKHPCVLQCGAT
jgi:Aldo/keto reductase family